MTPARPQLDPKEMKKDGWAFPSSLYEGCLYFVDGQTTNWGVSICHASEGFFPAGDEKCRILPQKAAGASRTDPFKVPEHQHTPAPQVPDCALKGDGSVIDWHGAAPAMRSLLDANACRSCCIRRIDKCYHGADRCFCRQRDLVNMNKL